LREQPGRTPTELFQSLGKWKAQVRSVRFVEAALAQAPLTFKESRGRWFLRADMTTAITSTAAPEEVQIDVPRAVENELRRRLIGRRVVNEVGLDAATHEEAESALELALRRSRDLQQIAQRYPALLAVYLVGHGVYRYEAGNFYGTTSLRGIDQSAGPAFMTAVRQLHLETFEDMVIGDNALRYVAPILAHGGIPKYCLDDYFSLMLRDIEHVGGDAQDLLSFWRTRKSAFFGIDTPVRRFLLYGGDLARDFLDRSIDLVREYARTRTVVRPADIGLPPYVVAAFKKRGEKLPQRSGRARQRVARPAVTLDPWDTGGPQLILPTVTMGSRGSWRIMAEGVLQRVSASSHEVRELRLAPAKAWNVELTEGSSTVNELSVEGLDVVPALFFDPKGGALLPAAGGLRANEVWILAPAEAQITGIDSTGANRPLVTVQELPEPAGDWSGFALVHANVVGLRAISVKKTASDPERRVTVRPPAEGASLVGSPLESVASEDGLPVFAVPPQIVLPESTDFERSAWRIRLGLDDEWTNVELEQLPQGTAGWEIGGLLSTGQCSTVQLVIQGPLGADLRSSFVYVPGLEVTVPDRVVFPGDRHGTVSVFSEVLETDAGAIATRTALPCPEHEDRVQIVVAPTSAKPHVLLVAVPKIMWGVRRAASPEIPMTNSPSVITTDEIASGEATGLVVRTGIDDVPLQLALQSQGADLQASDVVRCSRGGRWVFDLGRFKNTLERAESSRLDLRLHVAQRAVVVGHVRRSLHISNIRARARVAGEFTSVDVEFDEEMALRDRVLRLWSCDRPWASPIDEPIPDGQVGTASLSRYDDLPAGSYLLEIVVDDGWTSPTRPSPRAPGVVRLSVGDAADIAQRLERLNLDDPLNLAEVISATGVIPHRLEDKELDGVAPALLEVAALALADPQSAELSSRRFSAVRTVLLADAGCLARTAVQAIECGRLEQSTLLPLALALGRAGASVDPSPELEPTLRALWEVSPALAARLDIGGPDENRASRCREFLGWDPSDGVESVPKGEAVSQLFIGIDADTLQAMARSIALIPDRLLSLDALVEANFEWLLAAKEDRSQVEDWWRQASQLVPKAAAAMAPAGAAHLQARRPPQGTVDWAGLPGATLAAAFHVMADTSSASVATRALVAALDFAPRLVQRDLVLARLLTMENELFEEMQ
jgi:hypothetical protein